MASAAHLVDTNVISELARPRPHEAVKAWARQISVVAVSAITVEEVMFGLARRPVARVRAWFDGFLGQHCQVLAVDGAIAAHAGDLRGRLSARGEVRTQAAMLIAATAAHHNLTLVTRNVRDFAGCGVTVLDPFR